MRILWHSNYPEWRPSRYGTMTLEEIVARLEELAGEARLRPGRRKGGRWQREGTGGTVKRRVRFSWLVAAATAVTATQGMEAWPAAVRAVLAGFAVGLWLLAVLSGR